MPSTRVRNIAYRALLPFAPSPAGRMSHVCSSDIFDLKRYEKILSRHHVLGASLLVDDGNSITTVYSSLQKPAKEISESSLFRVASITKTATTLVVLRLAEKGLLSIRDEVNERLPEPDAVLSGVTIEHLLCHTSGLQDVPAYIDALNRRLTYHTVLQEPNVRAAVPGRRMIYSNFGFGLLGCIIEHVSGLDLQTVFRRELFMPLDMRGAIDASILKEEEIIPITRVLPYRKGTEVRIPRLGRIPMEHADPLHRFGHTAGSLYTDAVSLQHMFSVLMHDGAYNGMRYLSPESVRSMLTVHATTSERIYGLGLVMLQAGRITEHTLYGHQGFAYGCVDGVFFEKETGKMMVFLNGGCSEARDGKLSLCNQDLLKMIFAGEQKHG